MGEVVDGDSTIATEYSFLSRKGQISWSFWAGINVQNYPPLAFLPFTAMLSSIRAAAAVCQPARTSAVARFSTSLQRSKEDTAKLEGILLDAAEQLDTAKTQRAAEPSKSTRPIFFCLFHIP